jgi:hypothetical protein
LGDITEVFETLVVGDLQLASGRAYASAEGKGQTGKVELGKSNLRRRNLGY